METAPNRYRFLETASNDTDSWKLIHTDNDTLNHTNTDTLYLVCYRFLRILYRYYLKESANLTDIPHIPHTDTDFWRLLHMDTDI